MGFDWEHCCKLCFASTGCKRDPWCEVATSERMRRKGEDPRAYEDSADDEQLPRWPGLEKLITLAGVRVKIRWLETPLGRHLNGCLGTIVKLGTATERYAVNVDNFGLKSIKPENLENMIKPLNRDNSGG